MVSGGELVEVATGTLINPKGNTMHHSRMDDNKMRIRLASVVPEYRDVLPPEQPPGVDEGDALVLGDCTKWVMGWPKSQIRLGGGLVIKRNNGATSPVAPSNKIVRPPARTGPRKVPNTVASQKESTRPLKEPAVVTTTTQKEPAVVTTTTQKEPPVVANTTRKEPPVVATTTRHQVLLGAKPPQRPAKRVKIGRAHV